MTLKERIRRWAVKKFLEASAEGYMPTYEIVEILLSYKRARKLSRDDLIDILKPMVSENLEGRLDEDYEEDLRNAIEDLDLQLTALELK